MKRLGRIALFTLLACVAFFLVAGIYLGTGVRRIPLASRLIERHLSKEIAPRTVTNGGLRAGLSYDHGLKLDLALSDTRVLNADESELVSVPQVAARLDLRRMLEGRPRFDTVTIEQPVMTLRSVADTPNHTTRNHEPPFDVPSAEDVRRLCKRFGLLRLADASLRWGEEGHFTVLPIPSIEIASNGKEFQLQGQLGAADSVAPIHADFKPEGTDWVASGHWQNLSLITLLPPTTASPAWTGTLSGDSNIRFHPDHTVDVNVKLEELNGTYSNSSLFMEPIPLDSLTATVNGRLVKDNLAVTIPSIELTSGPVHSAISGTLQWKAEGLTADLESHTQGMTAPLLGHYWPLTMAPNSRHWVVEHLQQGIAGDSRCGIHLRPGDLERENLPAHAIEAEIPLHDASIVYLPNMPAAEGIAGTLRIDGVSLTADILSAHSFRAVQATQGTVQLPNFNDPTIPLKVKLELAGPASDVANALSPQHMNIGSKLKLDPRGIQGQVKGLIDLYLILYPENAGPVSSTHTEVDYAAEADISGVTQDHILSKWKVEGLNGHFSAHSGAFSLTGRATLQGVPGELAIAQTDVPDHVEYDWKARMPVGKMAAFGPHVPDWISGVIGLDATVVDEGKRESVQAALDLTDTDLYIADWRYKKPAGTDAHLSLTHLQVGNASVSEVPDFTYRTGDDVLHGSLSLSSGSDIVRADVPQVHFRGSDLSMHFVQTGSQRQVTLDGERLDASPWWKEKRKDDEADKDPFSTMHDLDLTVGLQEVRFDEGSSLKHVSGHILCGAAMCSEGYFDAESVHGKPITYRIDTGADGRHVALQAADSGELLQVLDISRHVKEGDLTFEGKFDDTKPNHPLKGHVLMNNFRITNAPIATRLLSLASLTGLADTLSGKGIRFKRLSGDVIYTRGDLVLNRLIASGPAIGVVVEGAVEDGQEVSLNGTLIPSYTANSFIGKLPVLGDFLVGGEGEGVFGIRFGVKGSVSDPQVSVNPFSLLTPGFLRRVFDIGKDDPQEMSDRMGAAKKAEQTEGSAAAPSAPNMPEETSGSPE